MNEEEKEAIEHFNDLNYLYGIGVDTFKYTDSEYDNSKILLNLIEKQQKEIGNWEIHCTIDLEREITELNNKNFEYKAKIEKKDKIIDEMAKYLYEDDNIFGFGRLIEINTPEKIKQYFERKIEQ